MPKQRCRNKGAETKVPLELSELDVGAGASRIGTTKLPAGVIMIALSEDMVSVKRTERTRAIGSGWGQRTVREKFRGCDASYKQSVVPQRTRDRTQGPTSLLLQYTLSTE